MVCQVKMGEQEAPSEGVEEVGSVPLTTFVTEGVLSFESKLQEGRFATEGNMDSPQASVFHNNLSERRLLCSNSPF